MLPTIAIPALVALIFKIILLGYSARFSSKTLITRWFIGLLVVLALHNLAEVLLLYHFVHNGITRIAAAYGYAYIAFLIVAIAIILDISLRLSLDPQPNNPLSRLRPLLYLPTATLVVMLLFTDQLVAGFQPFKNTVLRRAGPWYFLFETYLLLYFQLALAYLVFGSRVARGSALRRLRSRTWLIGIAPMVLLLDYLIIANHFGVAKITSTIYLPVALTFFLIVTTYDSRRFLETRAEIELAHLRARLFNLRQKIRQKDENPSTANETTSASNLEAHVMELETSLASHERVWKEIEALPSSPSRNQDLPHSLDSYVADFEKQLIEKVLKFCDGHKSNTARLLGLTPSTLHYKLERYGLVLPLYRRKNLKKK